ncbi:MAG: pyridoxal phosphate-dependent aminotransferase [Cellvibrionaceae bacterium]
MTLRFARRIQHIEPFRVMSLLARAQELEEAGKQVIHMEVGEPDFPCADILVGAGQKALEQGQTRYTSALGIWTLRKAISDYYQQRFSVEVEPERIVITAGASGALMLLSALLVNEGEGLLVTDPGYPCNPHFLQVVGGEGQSVPVSSESHYQLTPELIEQYWQKNTVGVLAASPANPTGEVISKREMQALYDTVTSRQGALVVDEIYQGLTYSQESEATDFSALSVSDDIYVINSFSKYFGMTGWRLGWLVAPKAAIPELEKLAQNLFICASTVSQYAALEAFSETALEEFENRRQELQTRRDYLLPALRELGFEIPHTPEGAFYLYANIEKFGLASEDFCHRLLEEHFVAITPGTDFGKYQADNHVRFAYTQPVPIMRDAISRIRLFVESL